jgi:hypothetical protein
LIQSAQVILDPWISKIDSFQFIPHWGISRIDSIQVIQVIPDRGVS